MVAKLAAKYAAAHLDTLEQTGTEMSPNEDEGADGLSFPAGLTQHAEF